MTRQRKTVLAGALIASIAALGIGQAALDASEEVQVQAPTFEVDPFWPKPLPNHWVMGNVIGVGIDSNDHVFIVHRPPAVVPEESGLTEGTSECCTAAPPVLEFDPAGNLVNAWGGESTPEYTWPSSNHGIGVDQFDNLWIGGNGGGDSHILKFTHDGEFIAQIGIPGQDPNSLATDHYSRVAKISFDGTTDEAFVADGYGNHRVAVVDMNTNEIKRFWGAYGNKPSDENYGRYDPNAPLIDQFRNPVHCAEPSNDGLVYVCDRPNDRIQVFRRDGTFVMEKQIAPQTLGDGSVWDIAFSADPEQTYLYLADGKNMKIYIFDRASMEMLTSFGQGGKNPGQWFAVHSMATDSQGNIYTTETYEGKRVQKFVYQGLAPVTTDHDASVWPGEE